MNLKIGVIVKHFTFISILIGCIGILISNIQISSYNIPIFNSIDSRVLYIGFVFALFIIVHVLIYAMFFDYNEFHNNNLWFVFLITVAKLIVLSNLIISIIMKFNFEPIVSGMNLILGLFFIISLLFSFPLLFLILLGGFDNIKNSNKDILSLFLFKISLCFSLINSLIVFIFFFIKVGIFKDIVRFEVYFAFLFFILFLWIVADDKDKVRGINVSTASYFSKTPQTRNLFDKIYFYFYFLIVLLSLVRNYSNHVYKHIDKDLGGGKIETIEIYTKSNKVFGNLILQTSKYIFVEQDSMLLKIDWDNIDKIKIEK